MGEHTKIQWTDHTFNPWIGCQRVSEGCNNCYAEGNRFVVIQRSQGRELWGNQKRSVRHVTSHANWRKPLAWNAAAEAAGVRARVFCASLADVFEDRPELEGPRARLFTLIDGTPWLDWQILTKRPENVPELAPHWFADGCPPNVWIGTSVENQARADERIPHLLRIPATVRFLSCEPLIGPVSFRWLAAWRRPNGSPTALRSDAAGAFGTESTNHLDALREIHWVIVGGESGPGARPFDVAWAREIIGQCREAGAAPFVKQLGSHAVTVRPDPLGIGDIEYRARLSDSKGGDWSEWPADLRVRQMPKSPAAAVTP